jgi:hypothetical protein
VVSGKNSILIPLFSYRLNSLLRTQGVGRSEVSNLVSKFLLKITKWWSSILAKTGKQNTNVRIRVSSCPLHAAMCDLPVGGKIVYASPSMNGCPVIASQRV